MVEHRQALALRDVRFIVSAAGVIRVRSRGQREVIAFARGVLTESPFTERAQRVRFDPYRANAFTLDDGTPISAAAVAFFLQDGSCWAVPHHGNSRCVPPSSPSASP